MNKLIEIFKKITKRQSDTEMAAKELLNAKRNYLEHKTHQEYFMSQCSFELQRIARLEKYLEESKND